MKVDIYIATVQTELREVRLTKSIAKQFPIKYKSDRWELMYKNDPDLPKPICKINGKTLGASGWLILVEDDVAGLAWDYPVFKDERTRGDDLAEIPTVIL